MTSLRSFCIKAMVMNCPTIASSCPHAILVLSLALQPLIHNFKSICMHLHIFCYFPIFLSHILLLVNTVKRFLLSVRVMIMKTRNLTSEGSNDIFLQRFRQQSNIVIKRFFSFILGFIVTEAEVEAGLLKVNNANRTAICFCRNLTDIDLHTKIARESL